MRQLVLLRGSMGAGKSTFIKEKNLQQYTLSPDDIRLLFQTPVLTETGKPAISTQNEKRVWNLLFELLERRMERGEFTIIDATHSKQSDFSKYRELAQKYRYRVSCVDFTGIPIEVTKTQNLMRPEYKHVPDKSIENLYERFKTQRVPNWVTTINPEEFDEFIQYRPIDLSEWKKIHHIGDIHGCYDVLMEYLDGGIKDDELYIFVGDWLDRGIQNGEVLQFLNSIKDNKNVIFIEGNHEFHVWCWANGDEIKSREFKERTAPDLETKGIDKKEARMLYRKVRQLVYYTYNDKTVLVTHGGISTLPDNLMFVASEQFIKGVGKYETPIDQYFTENTKENIYQIHGHRNIQHYPVQVTERTFNLEGDVEQGGYLRVVTLTKDGFEAHEVKNEIVHPRFKKREVINEVSFDTINLIEDLRSNPHIIEKKNETISSFNFSNRVFYDKLWDEQTIKARGLFLNTVSGEIVARSYNKFFNVNERSFTRIDKLAKTLEFPVDVYDKPNGFLGILGYDSQSDEMLFCSKSTVNGDYAEYFREIFDSIVEDEKKNKIKEYIKNNNVSLTFEVIDIHRDPHIIEYDQNRIILLDIVSRTADYRKKVYEEVVRLANKFGLEYKEHKGKFDHWHQFYDFYQKVTSDDFEDKIEGFVVEDSSGFMTKIKVGYYSFWKQMRGLKDKMSRKEPRINLPSLHTVRHNAFYNWCKNQDKEYLSSSSIIELRKAFELGTK